MLKSKLDINMAKKNIYSFKEYLGGLDPERVKQFGEALNLAEEYFKTAIQKYPNISIPLSKINQVDPYVRAEIFFKDVNRFCESTYKNEVNKAKAKKALTHMCRLAISELKKEATDPNYGSENRDINLHLIACWEQQIILIEYYSDNKEKNLGRRAIALFCKMVDESGLLTRGEKNNEVYCEEVCKRFGIEYTVKVSKEFGPYASDRKIDYTATKHNEEVESIKELIIPNLSDSEKETINTLINSKKLYG